MIELQLVQGSNEWLVHRQHYRNASDTPSVTGSSTYKSRAAFLKERATGIASEVDSATQRRFDEGHLFEKLARPLMEKIIGEDLFPVVGVDGLYSASFDGLTMMGDTNGEHKTLNDAIRACQTAADLPLMYREQMEHQMMVSGAGRSLFMASKWAKDSEGGYYLEDEKHFWYEPDMALRQTICAAWDQFEIDVSNYVTAEVIPAAVAAPTLDLPAVSIEASGSIMVVSNLKKFGEQLNYFIERLPTKPSTDQEFADCKAALSKLKLAEETLDSEESRALAQMSEIDEMRREKRLYQDLARTTRLALEKLVTARESAIKVEIVSAGKAALVEHIVGLNTRLGKPYMPVVAENFSTVIKNKRTVASLQDAVDIELARCKIAANEISDKIQINLNSMRELASEHAFLFADTAAIVLKANDDLVVLVKSRIAEHKADQERKIEAEREKIRQEERVKAEREQAHKAEAEKREADRIAAEKERARKDAEAEQQNTPPPATAQPVPEIAPVLSEQPVVQKEASAPACIAYNPAIPADSLPSLLFKIQSLVKLFDDENFTESEIDRQIHYAERQVIERSRVA